MGCGVQIQTPISHKNPRVNSSRRSGVNKSRCRCWAAKRFGGCHREEARRLVSQARADCHGGFINKQRTEDACSNLICTHVHALSPVEASDDNALDHIRKLP